jgi:hypothetical protein
MPFDAHAFCEVLATSRGRPIHLLPIPLVEGPGGLTGACLTVADKDIIFYESRTSAWHQDHIILHEAAHLLLGHNSDIRSNEESLRQLFPDFRPEVVRQMLQRQSYTREDEREAELLATLILERAGGVRASAAQRWPLEPDDPVRRLEAILDGGNVRSHD